MLHTVFAAKSTITPPPHAPPRGFDSGIRPIPSLIPLAVGLVSTWHRLAAPTTQRHTAGSWDFCGARPHPNAGYRRLSRARTTIIAKPAQGLSNERYSRRMPGGWSILANIRPTRRSLVHAILPSRVAQTMQPTFLHHQQKVREDGIRKRPVQGSALIPPGLSAGGCDGVGTADHLAATSWVRNRSNTGRRSVASHRLPQVNANPLTGPNQGECLMLCARSKVRDTSCD